VDGEVIWSRDTLAWISFFAARRRASRAEAARTQGSGRQIPLTRRDVRVVEGARLEIALTVCDGVLQISITVAKPTT